MIYLNSIKLALFVCPIIAILISGVYFLIQYKKYGAVSFYRSIVLYLFMLYCICAFFLVIFPLPDPAVVEASTRNMCQFKPFEFIKIFFRDSGIIISNPGTYLSALTSMEFLQPALNFCLLLPLGMFLRYYFGCDKIKTLVVSFGFTMFFELTQLTGLYGYYGRAYRVFDIDDLILNTAGSMLGYWIAKYVIRLLPSRKTIDEKAYQQGKRVSFRRRGFAVLVDAFIEAIMAGLIMVFMFGGTYVRVLVHPETLGPNSLRYTTLEELFDVYGMVFIIVNMVYMIGWVTYKKGKSFGKILVGIALGGENKEISRWRILARQLCKFIIVFRLFYGVNYTFIPFNNVVYWILEIITCAYFVNIIYSIIRNFRGYKYLWYERLTGVINVSNIKSEEMVNESEEVAALASVNGNIDHEKESLEFEIKQETMSKNEEKNMTISNINISDITIIDNEDDEQEDDYDESEAIAIVEQIYMNRLMGMAE